MGFSVEPTSYNPPAVPIPDIKIIAWKVQYTKDRFYHTLITNVMCVAYNERNTRFEGIYLDGYIFS